MGGGCCLFIPLKQYLTTLKQCKLLNYSFLIFCKNMESPFPPCPITQQEQNLRPCVQPLKGHCKNPMHSNSDNLTLPRQRVMAGEHGLPLACCDAERLARDLREIGLFCTRSAMKMKRTFAPSLALRAPRRADLGSDQRLWCCQCSRAGQRY